MKDNRLYVVTHADLSVGYQTAQVAHAVTEFLFTYPEQARKWYQSSNYIVVVEAPDRQHLERLQHTALTRGILSAPFCEPDLGNEITAIAFPPSADARKLLGSYPLAGKRISKALAASPQESKTLSRLKGEAEEFTSPPFPFYPGQCCPEGYCWPEKNVHNSPHKEIPVSSLVEAVAV